jgi:hypothetical protein
MAKIANIQSQPTIRYEPARFEVGWYKEDNF